ncbi:MULTISPECIES: GNAT family N-acetyltransferase [Kitasatospora]|uniref:Putative acetyltransferase n=1 Tax=Kitasatospora setae (strain ATCC 33774 / DSM 43861 / JCM 3304 / KCC A-0304 / NBRC 14216 / KM-6054) TaxID=452652 RepID=E4NGA0_KITSK|nr:MULTISPECIES: GNAT family N-acetyltransferase [Kitasatospora]BAJ30530.1 putative acetyltransferase [Kitasatospora setae KM-6054]
MVWTLTTSLDEFRAAAGEFLAADPAENTVLLTIVDRVERDGPLVYGDTPPRYGWWREPDGTVTGATLRTPPYGQRLGRMTTDAAGELARLLATEPGPGPAPGQPGQPGQPGELGDVGGGREVALAFAAAWERQTGRGWFIESDERLYRLGELTPPPAPPAGRSRLASAADRELLGRWLAAFCVEAGVRGPDDPLLEADQRIAAGTLLLWEDADGRVVSMAGASPAVAGMSRIGPVYTPRERRGRGYASALTAAASAHARAGGAAEVLLYTDLANPTSNAIYQRIGYVPVGDSAHVAFR